MEELQQNFVHETAIIDKSVIIGKGTKIWVNAQIRENVTIGSNCVISKDVYIDKNVTIGNACKIQNGVSLYQGVTLQDEVFVGPNAVFTNDKVPRATNTKWDLKPTMVKKGASIGANATIVCGITLGEYCMVGAGAVVTKDVPPFTLVYGNPAKHIATIDYQGNIISRNED